MGSEDIRKQLPQETKMFEGVNDAFIACTLEMHVSSISPCTFSLLSGGGYLLQNLFGTRNGGSISSNFNYVSNIS